MTKIFGVNQSPTFPLYNSYRNLNNNIEKYIQNNATIKKYNKFIIMIIECNNELKNSELIKEFKVLQMNLIIYVLISKYSIAHADRNKFLYTCKSKELITNHQWDVKVQLSNQTQTNKVLENPEMNLGHSKIEDTFFWDILEMGKSKNGTPKDIIGLNENRALGRSNLVTNCLQMRLHLESISKFKGIFLSIPWRIFASNANSQISKLNCIFRITT
ncbi:hypothetical protein H8356DRAFT_1416135 [Neocallimastix lanati (nom. inval.)]|nr:hypothetical protein H8356DRAFT_1416135 [Neocallimastix sp. JGI-2020a]